MVYAMTSFPLAYDVFGLVSEQSLEHGSICLAPLILSLVANTVKRLQYTSPYGTLSPASPRLPRQERSRSSLYCMILRRWPTTKSSIHSLHSSQHTTKLLLTDSSLNQIDQVFLIQASTAKSCTIHVWSVGSSSTHESFLATPLSCGIKPLLVLQQSVQNPDTSNSSTLPNTICEPINRTQTFGTTGKMSVAGAKQRLMSELKGLQKEKWLNIQVNTA